MEILRYVLTYNTSTFWLLDMGTFWLSVGVRFGERYVLTVNLLNAPTSFVKWKSDTVKMYLSPKTYPWWLKSQNVLKLESERTSSSLDEVVILLTWSLVRCNPLFLLREVTLYGDFSNAEVQETFQTGVSIKNIFVWWMKLYSFVTTPCQFLRIKVEVFLKYVLF